MKIVVGTYVEFMEVEILPSYSILNSFKAAYD